MPTKVRLEKVYFMSVQKSQHHKRQSKSNKEWLDEMLDIIERMKNKL